MQLDVQLPFWQYDIHPDDPHKDPHTEHPDGLRFEIHEPSHVDPHVSYLQLDPQELEKK